MIMTDPVCGREVKDSQAVATETYGALVFGFCSKECHQQFLANPTAYVSHDPSSDALIGTTEDTHTTPQNWRDDGDLDGPP